MATRVERSGIEDCVAKINNAIEELKSAASNINRTMDELPNYWEGAAYEKARNVYDDEYKEMLITTVPNAVDSFKSYIDQCMQKIIELDNQLAGG